MTELRSPAFRAEVVDAVRSLSDREYQDRVWIRREYPTPTFFDSFDENVHILFDDMLVLPDPEQAVGGVVYPDEVDVLRALGAVLDPLIDELGDVDDARYLAHPRWTDVLRTAADAHRVLHANDVARGTG